MLSTRNKGCVYFFLIKDRKKPEMEDGGKAAKGREPILHTLPDTDRE